MESSVILSDVRNHRRKMIPRALDVVQKLNIPANKLIFHLHTNSETQEDFESYRYNVRADIEILGLDFVVGPRNGMPSSSLSMSELADLYAASDVHLLTSFGEGFGLPTLQAASAGVVTVVPANSASIELVEGHGFAIPCDLSSTDEFGLRRTFINRRKAAGTLETLYHDSRLLHASSEAARNFALQYNWNNIVRRWDKLLAETKTSLGLNIELKPTVSNQVSDRRSSPHDPKLRSLSHVPKVTRHRPSGHTISALPLPMIGIPVRLELRRETHLSLTPPSIIVELSVLMHLRQLHDLFPGLIVQGVTNSELDVHEVIKEFINKAALVVDPDGKLNPCLDELCAVAGINYLGRSTFWSPVTGGSLLFQVRRLLTDHPYCEARVLSARIKMFGFHSAETAGKLVRNHATNRLDKTICGGRHGDRG